MQKVVDEILNFDGKMRKNSGFWLNIFITCTLQTLHPKKGTNAVRKNTPDLIRMICNDLESDFLETQSSQKTNCHAFFDEVVDYRANFSNACLNGKLLSQK